MCQMKFFRMKGIQVKDGERKVAGINIVRHQLQNSYKIG